MQTEKHGGQDKFRELNDSYRGVGHCFKSSFVIKKGRGIASQKGSATGRKLDFFCEAWINLNTIKNGCQPPNPEYSRFRFLLDSAHAIMRLLTQLLVSSDGSKGIAFLHMFPGCILKRS